MLTAVQKSEFDEHGYLHLPCAIPEEDVQSVLGRIWDDLEQRCGIPREAPEHWPETRPKGFNTLTRSGAFAPTCNQVFAVLETLAAQGGATIALSGSHRVVRHLARQPELIGEGRSKDIRKAVQRAAPDLRDLWSRDHDIDRSQRYLRKPVDVFGIPVQAVEFTVLSPSESGMRSLSPALTATSDRSGKVCYLK